jgi:hypothetical protein
VVALQTETAPPMLRSFFPEFLENLRAINETEGRNYPAPPIPQILSNPSFLPSVSQNSSYSEYATKIIGNELDSRLMNQGLYQNSVD